MPPDVIKGDVRFAHYIKIMTKKIVESYDAKGVVLTAESLAHLNVILNYLTRHVVERAEKIRKAAKKETATFSHISSAIELIFKGDLRDITLEAIQKAMSSYAKRKSQKGRIIDKAQIDLPPARFRSFFTAKMVSGNARIAIAAAMNFIIGDLIEAAIERADLEKRKKISTGVLSRAVDDDPTYYEIFRSLGILISGNGVRPSKDEVPKKVRFHQSQSRCVNIPEAVFKRKVKKCAPKEFKFSKDALLAMQTALESNLVEIMMDANKIAENAKRVRLAPKDFELAVAIRCC